MGWEVSGFLSSQVHEAGTSKRMMAAHFLLQFLLFGTLLVPAYLQEACGFLEIHSEETESNFSVTVTPEEYTANTSYLVTISDERNTTTGRNVTMYLLQALSPENTTAGEWNVTNKQDCSGVETAVLNAPEESVATANWTSPSNLSSVEIRAYIIFDNSSTNLKRVTLQEVPQTDPTTPSTTPDSGSTVQSSFFFIAVTQLLMLLATSKLLS